MGFAYALKHRAETDGHLSDAHKFKVAGSVALRKGKLDVAVEQYLLGEECAAKLDGVWYLNGAFCARGPPLRLACLNNAALARLKQKEWEKAAELCVRALALEGVARRSGGDETVAAAEVVQRYRLPRAKSYFRLDGVCGALPSGPLSSSRIAGISLAPLAISPVSFGRG